MGLGAAEDPARRDLRVATYNVENYTLADRIVQGVFQPAYPKSEDAKAALRSVIRRLDADVLALQEIGGEKFLAELVRDLKAEGLVYPFALALEASDPERQIAVLSRLPVLETRSYTDLTFTYFGQPETVKRGLLECRFDSSAGPWALFVVHLKSRYTEREDDPASAQRRLGEARVIRDRILSLTREASAARYLILGDFNDGLHSPVLRALMARGKTDIARPLPAGDSDGETWTHRFAKEDTYTRVDHILIAPAMQSWVQGTGAVILDGADTRAASDHRPVMVTLRPPR